MVILVSVLSRSSGSELVVPLSLAGAWFDTHWAILPAVLVGHGKLIAEDPAALLLTAELVHRVFGPECEIFPDPRPIAERTEKFTSKIVILASI